jgi:mono/diheme cytochrome c family protein
VQMSKRPFVIFGLVVAVLAVLIPFLAFRSNGDPDNGVSRDVPSDLQAGKMLFETNCGTCHTLYAAGTDGNFGPDLDLVLAPAGPPTGSTAQQTIKATKSRVLNAIENGVDSSTTPGRMPAGILAGQQADEVANFVAHVAGQG